MPAEDAAPPWREIVSTTLTEGQLLVEIPQIVGLLLAWKIHRVEVAYGWGCNLDIDELWKPVEVSTDEVERFVRDGQASGAFQAGEGDLLIESSTPEFSIRLCHESDIHVATTDENLYEAFRAAWTASGTPFIERTGS